MRGLMAVFGPVVYTCAGFNEDVLKVGHLGDFGLPPDSCAVGRLRSCAALWGMKQAPACKTAWLQGHRVGTLLINRPSWQTRLSAKRTEHCVQISRGAEVRTRILDAMCEAPAEFVARVPDRIIPWETSFGTELTISHRVNSDSQYRVGSTENWKCQHTVQL
jgi:hypothetical protein